VSGLATGGQVGAIWMDGGLVAPEQAQLSVLSFGLHNASCVFDGIRVYHGRPFALDAHVSRFFASAETLGMSLPVSRPAMVAAISLVIGASMYPDLYLRPVAWRGDEVIGIDPATTTTHVAVAALRWPASRTAHTVRLGLSRWARPAPHMAPVTAKASANYVVGALALADAARDGFDDALLLDHRGYVAEATGANVFVVRDGRLRTPIADTFLDGVTRRTVIRLANEAGIPVEIGRLTVADAADADEIFLTGTAAEVQPVDAFGDRVFVTDRPVTNTLAQAYRRLVRAAGEPHRQSERTDRP